MSNEDEEETAKPEVIYQIPILTSDIEALIAVLNFADKAATMLAHQEIKQGSGVTAAAKFTRLSRDAQELVTAFIKHIEVGEPTDGQIH